MCFLASSRQMSIPLSIQLLYLGMGLVNRAQTSTEQRWDLILVLGLALSLQHFLVRNCINVTITLLKDREICFGIVKEPSAKGEKALPGHVSTAEHHFLTHICIKGAQGCCFKAV